MASNRKPVPKRSIFNPKRWLLNIAISADLVLNAVFLGSPTETMSGRMGRTISNKSRGFGGWMSRTICAGLNWLDKGHCLDTYEYEKSLGLHRPESLGDKPGD
jgi:hypothetical protein